MLHMKQLSLIFGEPKGELYLDDFDFIQKYKNIEQDKLKIIQ